MLTRLVIQDVVLIDRLSVPFEAGLNVFTGETGAGKSILLDALALALGARSDAGLIRAGQTQASVTAEFSGAASPTLADLFERNGLLVEDPLILRRTIHKDGKSRAFVCDQPIGVTLLRQIGEHLLEIHGQFETHGLLNPATHRGLLDSFAGASKLRENTAKTFHLWHQAIQKRDEALALQRQAKAEEDFLRDAVAEMDEVAPQADEVEKLAEQRTRLQHREKILDALTAAENALSNERGAVSAVAVAGKSLAKIADKAADIADILAIIDRAASELNEATAQLAHTIHNIDSDSASLEKIEERLFRLRALARKHGVQPETLGDLARDLKHRLSLLSDKGNQLGTLEKAVHETRGQYLAYAQELSATRSKAAQNLAKAIMQELPPLKLERAVFVVECNALAEAQWNADGMDRVAFLASANAGNAPAPLHKVASGGELARFMLAIKVVLSKADPIQTLVFDEVDSGIGGATASAVGERLAALGHNVQVLVVTHSPQVAARGNHHLRVKKQEKGKFPTTLVDALSHDQRVEELARMLAGAQTTDAARQAAQSLLDDAVTAPKASKKKARS